jgi:hypothetical protein
MTPCGSLAAHVVEAVGPTPPDGSDFYSRATCGHDNSGFTFRIMHDIDDSGFDLRASCGPDDSSRHLLGCACLATGRPTGALRAVDWCGTHLPCGSFTSDVDYGATGLWQPKLYITATLSPVLKSVWATLVDPHWRAAMEE